MKLQSPGDSVQTRLYPFAHLSPPRSGALNLAVGLWSLNIKCNNSHLVKPNRIGDSLVAFNIQRP